MSEGHTCYDQSDIIHFFTNIGQAKSPSVKQIIAFSITILVFHVLHIYIYIYARPLHGKFMHPLLKITESLSQYGPDGPDPRGLHVVTTTQMPKWDIVESESLQGKTSLHKYLQEFGPTKSNWGRQPLSSSLFLHGLAVFRNSNSISNNPS